MTLRIVTGKAEWDAATARVRQPSVCLSYDYVKAAELLEEDGRAELAIWEDAGEILVHPAIRRPVPGAPATYDLTSAYEFGGFWSSASDPDRRAGLMRGFGAAFATHARANGVVSEFMRLHPFTDGPLTALAYEVRQAAQHTVVRLDRPHEEIFAGYDPKLRTAVRKAERHDLRLVPATDFGPFLATYYANLDRLGARRYYYFDRAFFERSRALLALYHVVDPSGQICATHVYLRDGEVLFSFLCHGVRARLDLRPNDFAHDQVIRRSGAAGVQAVHLGGGHPSLLRYKAKFSPGVVPFFIATRIFDHDAYDALLAARVRACGPELLASTYFPRYRAIPPLPEHRPERNRSDAADDEPTS